MNTQRIEVFKKIRSLLQEGKPAFLVTVLETWGASPRPAGSVLVFDPLANKVFGSVSGGCVEEDLLEHLRSPASLQAADAYPCTERYGSDSAGYDLPCGATIELLIELFDPAVGESGSDHISSLLEQVEYSGRLCRRVELVPKASLSLSEFPEGAHGEVWREETCIYLRFSAPDKLLLIGATDVAHYLAPLARQLGYQVVISEPRRSFLDRQPLLESFEYVKDRLPDDLVYQSYFDESSAVVALAHDPRVDDLAVYAALQGEAHFVGALGSQRNAHLRTKRLMALGLSEGQLAKLRAPVGLTIGSHTPTEIAISIAAQLIEVRSKRANTQSQGSFIGKFGGAIDNVLV